MKGDEGRREGNKRRGYKEIGKVNEEERGGNKRQE